MESISHRRHHDPSLALVKQPDAQKERVAESAGHGLRDGSCQPDEPKEIDAATDAERTALERPVLLGCIALPRDRKHLLWVLSLGAIACATAFSTLQEWVFRVPGFRFGGWMTLWMYITYFTSAAIERVITRDTVRRVALKHYLVVAMLAVSAVYLTNWSVTYVSYATRMVLKSSRILPVMLIGVLVQRKQYSWQEFAAAGLFGFGVSIFTVGEAQSTLAASDQSLVGAVILLAAVLADAYTANLEEKHFFRIPVPASNAEVMFHLSGFAIGPAALAAVLGGELIPAARHSFEHPFVIPGITLFSMMGYLSVCLILMIIRYFDATLSEIVKSTRKVLQVFLSVVVYSKSISLCHVVGGAAVVAALWWLRRTEVAKEKGLLVTIRQHQQNDSAINATLSSAPINDQPVLGGRGPLLFPASSQLHRQ